MKEIHFKISVEEGNLIFKGLSKLPFEDVYELIGKLNEQANAQLKGGASSPNHTGKPSTNGGGKFDDFLQ